MLARGELHCIGATTLDEYRKYIEKDAALERRFQPVMVAEPTVEDTISILRGLKERYEIFHGVRIHDNALVAAATLSDRYITDRFLPDKAIDLVDEACAMIRTEIDSMPSELDDIRRKIMQQEIEEMALKKEDDQLSRDRLAKLTEELAENKDKFNAMKARWEAEREGVDAVKRIKGEIEQLGADIENAQMNLEYEKAAKLKYSDLPELQKKLAEAEAAAEKRGTDDSLVHDTVTEEEIANIVAKWTASPSPSSWRASARSCCTWRTSSTSAWSARTRPSGSSPRPYSARGPASPTPTGPSAASSSSAPPAWARRSWPRAWPSASSTTSATWCVST